MEGKIIKGIAGFYYVHTPHMGVYECKAKGIFRSQKIKPLVGDNVEFTVIEEQQKKGNIITIQPRKTMLIRPAVANIDQAVILFAMTKPTPNLNLLDRFLVMMTRQQINTLICFNKCDLVQQQEQEKLAQIYKHSGYEVLFISAKEQIGISKLVEKLEGKTTVLAGPSGVGKSTTLNAIFPKAQMITAEISQKIERGKHTTRHSELFILKESTYLMDTPGFSSFYINEIQQEELKEYFLEFLPYERECQFQGCMHLKETGCAVKKALEKEQISRQRYENYALLYEELKAVKRY